VDAATRALVAFIAGRLITGVETWAVTDHDRKRKVFLDGSFEGGEIKIYSHERHNYISGVGEDGRYVLFQHDGAGGCTLTIDLDQAAFTGHQQQSGFHFFGNVCNRTVRLYDYHDTRWHFYTL